MERNPNWQFLRKKQTSLCSVSDMEPISAPLPPEWGCIPFPSLDFHVPHLNPFTKLIPYPVRSLNGPTWTSEPAKSWFCRRRWPFLESVVPSTAAVPRSDDSDVLKKFHPLKLDWYKELFASLLNNEAHDAEVERYKSEIFSNLRGKEQKILEIGIGSGSNFRYYASNSNVQVVGLDPNQEIEKCARSRALSAGLPPSNFEFIRAVGEAIPLDDASVDAVVGTLVLCTVKDVSMTLKEMKRVLRPGGVYVFMEHVGAKEGTILRFIQRALNPLSRALNGCHLYRDTGPYISEAGFSRVELNTVSSTVAIYGAAYK